MSISQLKKELAGIREMLMPKHELGKVIIYDTEKGIPEELLGLNDGIVRIFIPDDGRDSLR
jgi:hypothetical protein